MATFTLAEAQKLGLDDLQAGIAETIVTAAPALALLPWVRVVGNAYTYNRELTLVNGQAVAADGTITDSSAMTDTHVSVPLTSISGQSDIPNLQLRQHIGAGVGNDLRSIHIKSAAKGVAREYMNRMINGTTSANGWDGLQAILTSSPFAAQVTDAANAVFTLDLVDTALTTMPGRPSFIMGNAKAEAAFKKALRSAGGVTTIELNGQYFSSYDGIPFVRNDWISNDYVSGTAGNQTDIYFGSWGDGTDLGGATGLTSSGDLFTVQEFDALEGKDATRVRVLMDGAFTVFSPVQVALLHNVTV